MIRSLEREIIGAENSFIFEVFFRRKRPTGNPHRCLKGKGPEEDGGNGNRKGKERTLHVARPRPLPADLHRTRPWGCGWPASYVTFPPCTASERASEPAALAPWPRAGSGDRPAALAAVRAATVRSAGSRRPPLLSIGLQDVLNNIPAGLSLYRECDRRGKRCL